MQPIHFPPLAVPFYQQQEEDYCGAACLQMVLACYKVEAKQEDLFRQAGGVPGRGTPLRGLAEAAKQCGRQGEWESQLSLKDVYELLSEGVPVIAQVRPEILYSVRRSLYSRVRRLWRRLKVRKGKLVLQPDLYHVIVIIGMVGDEVFFHDPGLPEQYGQAAVCPVERFLAAWGWAEQLTSVVIVR